MDTPENFGKVSLFGLNFDDVGKEEAARQVVEMAKEKQGGFVVTPNGNITRHALHDASFTALLQKASLTLPDGVSISLAARLLGKGLAFGRVAGVELGEQVIALAAEEGLSLYLFGGKSGVAEKAADCLCRRYPGLVIAGGEDGYGKTPDTVAQNIRAVGASLLFCCLGSPLQEFFAAELAEQLSLPILCLGGSLDIYAENKKRAPRFFRLLGCEWLWRTVCEPKRLARLPALFAFLCEILAAKCEKALAIPTPKGYNNRR